MFDKFVKDLLARITSSLKKEEQETNEEVPLQHKLKTRKIISPHVDKRVDRAAVAEPFGDSLAIVSNLMVAIDILTTQFNLSEQQQRKVEQIKKDLVVGRRQFVVLLGDKLAEQTYEKELTHEEELKHIYSVFKCLRSDNMDMFLEEWSYDIRQTIEGAFGDLMEVVAEEKIAFGSIIMASMQPDVKIRKAPKSMGPPPQGPHGHGPDFEGPDDDYDDDYDDGYDEGDEDIPF